MKFLAWYVSGPPVLHRQNPQYFRLRNRPGQRYTVPGLLREDRPIELCYCGLHGSYNLFYALAYGHGSWVHRIEAWGDVAAPGEHWHGGATLADVRAHDKFCASRRKHLWVIDGRKVLWMAAGQLLLPHLDIVRGGLDYARFLETGNKRDMPNRAPPVMAGDAWEITNALRLMLSDKRTFRMNEVFIGVAQAVMNYRCCYASFGLPKEDHTVARQKINKLIERMVIEEHKRLMERS